VRPRSARPAFSGARSARRSGALRGSGCRSCRSAGLPGWRRGRRG
jgi:hypothetical protein